MASSSPDTNPEAYFGFSDLHGFKDFVIEVIAGAPDDFMEMDWLKPSEQMNLDRAFAGLNYGLQVTANEKGESTLLAKCRDLVNTAHTEYRLGRDRNGQLKLQEMETLLNTLPSQ